MNVWLVKFLSACAIFILTYTVYRVCVHVFTHEESDKSRVYRVQGLLRFVFVLASLLAVLGLIAHEWLGLLISIGVIGVGVTIILQQPLLSVLGWLYITVRKPFEAGDRVKINDVKGEVLSIDLMATTLLQVNGELVSSNQPSGVLITVPNSRVLDTHVENFTSERFPWVWSEIVVQVSFESDIEFVKTLMKDTADELLGEKMEDMIEDYRSFLEHTPLEIEIGDRPSVNIHQKESWVECRLRYLTHPRKGQQTKNELYENILGRMNEHPDRVSFPVSRSR